MKTFFIYDRNCKSELQISVGVNANDNWSILDKSCGNDYWFHVSNSSSSHVILKVPENKEVTKDTLITCASICKQHSSSKNDKNTDIIFTKVSNVKKSKYKGSVIALETRTLKI